MNSTVRIVTVALATAVGVAGLKVIATAQGGEDAPAAHVLLLSVDGLHGFDIERFIANNPQSTLARLSNALAMRACRGDRGGEASPVMKRSPKLNLSLDEAAVALGVSSRTVAVSSRSTN